MDRMAATMKKWEKPHSWGPEISSFLQDLRTKSLDELLKVNSCTPSGQQLSFLTWLQDPFLTPRAIRGLRWLATAANKEVRHELKRLNRDGVRYNSL